MQQKPPDSSESLIDPTLALQLEKILLKLQERIVTERTSDAQFALVHLVEGLSLEEWKKIVEEENIQGWLALPLDGCEGVPLQILRDMLVELTYQRDHDPLTSLANRRLFDRQLILELNRATRSKTPLSLVLLDIDNFKDINDTHGHAVGDTVLIELGAILSRSHRPYDVAARVGGEEFCLILPGAMCQQAVDLATRILEEFRRHVFTAPEGATFSVTFSAGVATAFPCSMPIEPHVLYTQADELLYKAKRQGKNRVVALTSLPKLADNPALVQASEKHFLFTGISND